MFKKGERIEFNYKDETLYGFFVRKKSIRTSLFVLDDGKVIVGYTRNFRHSEQEIPENSIFHKNNMPKKFDTIEASMIDNKKDKNEILVKGMITKISNIDCTMKTEDNLIIKGLLFCHIKKTNDLSEIINNKL